MPPRVTLSCLHVWPPQNVYAPSAESTSERLAPVMVFIHGGAFFFGGANDLQVCLEHIR